MSDEINGYQLSRNWFDWCFENPEKISPNHSAIYFFAIEHCNRLGWKKKFGFPTQMAMDAIGIKKHETYIRYFNDLVEWGFFQLIEKSRNQYSSNIISLENATPKNGKALGKAMRKHAGKQTQPNGESNRSIDKPLTLEPLTLERYKSKDQAFEQIKTEDLYLDEVHRLITGKGWRIATKVNVMQVFKFFLLAKANLENTKQDVKQHFKNWIVKQSVNDIIKICDEG